MICSSTNGATEATGPGVTTTGFAPATALVVGKVGIPFVALALVTTRLVETGPLVPPATGSCLGYNFCMSDDQPMMKSIATAKTTNDLRSI